MSTDMQAAAPNTDETTLVAGDQIAIQVIAEYIAECAQITVEQATDQAIELVGRLVGDLGVLTRPGAPHCSAHPRRRPGMVRQVL
ncbi:hypothetical protein [Rhodococcus sp. Q]|uniref:hypothetical protein n=1 Tax=Rhodococcus sp. Q TaxID=2502252 RepID=UPI0010F57841|nr:hypothetical protein [Rhodococcus sp. Q]